MVVIGAAFIFFAPVKSSSPVPFDIRGQAEPRQAEPGEYLANDPPGMVTTQTTSGDIIIVYGNNPDSTQATGTAPASPKVPADTPAQTTPAPAPAAPAAQSVKPAQPKPTATTITVAPTPTTSTPKAAPPTTVKKTAVPAASTASSSSFWIQAGSFKARDSADNLKAAFAEKGMVASIVVKDIDGKSYYQVKVGPYASREEARKWLTTVRAVPGSSPEAFVTQ